MNSSLAVFALLLLLERFGNLVGLSEFGSIPRTSGGSMGFPRYILHTEIKAQVDIILIGILPIFIFKICKHGKNNAVLPPGGDKQNIV